MKFFQIMIECTGLQTQLDGSQVKVNIGCFCTRYVSDIDEGIAIVKAKKTVQFELGLQSIECRLDQIEIESVSEIDRLPPEDGLNGQGFTFYEI